MPWWGWLLICLAQQPLAFAVGLVIGQAMPK